MTHGEGCRTAEALRGYVMLRSAGESAGEQGRANSINPARCSGCAVPVENRTQHSEWITVVTSLTMAEAASSTAFRNEVWVRHESEPQFVVLPLGCVPGSAGLT